MVASRARAAFKLPDAAGSSAPPVLTDHWLLGLQKGSALGGARHLPLLGLGGMMSAHHGAVWMVAMTAHSIGNKEGTAYPANVKEGLPLHG